MELSVKAEEITLFLDQEKTAGIVISAPDVDDIIDYIAVVHTDGEKSKEDAAFASKWVLNKVFSKAIRVHNVTDKKGKELSIQELKRALGAEHIAVLNVQFLQALFNAQDISDEKKSNEA